MARMVRPIRLTMPMRAPARLILTKLNGEGDRVRVFGHGHWLARGDIGMAHSSSRSIGCETPHAQLTS